MTMAPVHRRVTYKLYPSPAQAAEMERLCDLHRGLYNAALQERADAWRLARNSVGFAAQCRSLTRVRRENPDYLGVNAQSLQVTLKRLDLAFQAFFRRVKAGGTPGFPRYKGPRPLPGLRLQEPRRRLQFAPGAGWRHGRLRLSGIGGAGPGEAGRRAGSSAPTSGGRRTAGPSRWCSRASPSANGRARPRPDWTGAWRPSRPWPITPDEFAAFPNDRPLAEEQDAA